MDKIANTTSLISGIVEVYDRDAFQKELKSVLSDLSKEVSRILSVYADEYNLVTSNSVRPINYFTVVGRIKEKDSFHEKMIRGNLIYSFLECKNFKSKNQISNSHKNVQSIIKRISDDIIGIKILTELEQDCKKVISLFKDKYLALFNNKDSLYLNLDDLERQPVRMQNGLEFYKIRGVFKNDYKFELQIKSKLLSVWGDMDHSMFYKDYSVSPVKENVKASMVNLGNLIVQVDKFLLQIREAEHSFSKNREVIDFTEKFSKQYSGIFKSKLGFGYRLEDISEFLFYMYRSLPVKKRNIKARLDYSYLGTRGSDELVKYYVRVRNRDFNLQIIELVYFNWFSRFETNRIKKAKNFNRVIPDLLDMYLDYLSSHLKKDFRHYSVYLKNNLLNLSKYLNKGVMLYNFEKLNSFFAVLANIVNYSDMEVGKYGKKQLNYIKNLLLLIYYREGAELYLQMISKEVILSDLITTLGSIVFPLQEKTISEIGSFSNAQELIQQGLIILKKVSDEVPN